MTARLTGRVIGILVISFFLTAQSTRAEVLCWEFSVHPSEESVPMTGYARGVEWDGGTTNGTPYGGCVAGTGLQGDGTAVFADATCESNNSGFVYNWTGSGSFTMDIRVKVLESVGEAAGKSMTVKNDINQRGVKLRTDRVEMVSGTGVAGTWSNTDLSSDFRIIRVSVNATTVDNVATAYVWDSGTSSWTSLGNTTLGGSGGGGQVLQPGIGIGSLAGSSTQSGKFVIDYARVDNSQALGDTAPPLPPPPLPCGSTVTPTGPQSLSGYLGGLPVALALIDLGSPEVSDGLVHRIEGDGLTLVASVDGRSCRTNVAGGYMYFDVNNSLIYQGSKPSVVITFDYYDSGVGEISLDYDAIDDPGPPIVDRRWTTAETTVVLTNTNTWRRGSIAVDDAYFGDRENYGSDFRISGSGIQFYLDNVSVADPASHGPEVTYTLFNSGGTTITDWDAVEANADGSIVSPQHTWLTLTKTPAANTDLPPGTGASISAAFDTTSLTTSQTTYVKFIDGCTPAPYTEPFTYTAGTSLAGQGGWVGMTSGSDNPDYMEFKNDSGIQLILSGGGDSSVTHAVHQDLTTSVSGVVSVQLKVKLGGAMNEQSTFWDLRVRDSVGKEFAWWRGTQYDAHARKLKPSDPGIEPQAVFTSSYKVMEMKIDTDNKTVAYYFDGVLLATFSCQDGVGSAVSRIEFSRMAGVSTGAADYLLVDDLQVSSLGYKLRRIDLEVIGCKFAVEPAATSAIGCSGTSTRSFAVINTGVNDLTDLTVTPITSGGDPTSYLWLTLDVPGATLAPGESAEVVATIDWDNVIGTEAASLRFRATCGDSVLQHSLVDALTVSKPSAGVGEILMSYLGNVPPTDPNSAGIGLAFRVYEGVTQGTVVTDDAAIDKKAYQIEDIASAKTKFIIDPQPSYLDAVHGVTLVARVKTLSFAGGEHYGNIWIFAPTLTTEVYWGGPDGLLIEKARNVQVNLTPEQGADDQYHIIRIAARDTGGSTGIVINVYLDEQPDPVLSIVNAAPIDKPGGSSYGFGFGTQGTSNTQDIYFDYITATSLGAFAPGEEVACLGTSLIVTSPCHAPWADADDDGDVDQADFAVFQLCYTGPAAESVPSTPEYCVCMDQGDDDDDGQPDQDGNIDSFDLAAFQKCASAPGVPADPNCGG